LRTILLVAVAAALAAGCGLDCAGQSIPHCPGPGGAECVNGAWRCVLYDQSGEVPPDFSSTRDLTSSTD
jgi:hypothetical protein